MLPRDVHFDPVTDLPIHVDFMRVTDKSRVRVHVPVNFKNEGLSPGIKRGGVLNVVRHDIDVVCLAGDIPHAIIVDVERPGDRRQHPYQHGEAARGRAPAITERDFTIATIAPPTVQTTEAEDKAAADAAAAAAARRRRRRGAVAGAASGALPAPLPAQVRRRARRQRRRPPAVRRRQRRAKAPAEKKARKK